MNNCNSCQKFGDICYECYQDEKDRGMHDDCTCSACKKFYISIHTSIFNRFPYKYKSSVATN